MVTTRSKTRKLETGSTSRVVIPVDLITEIIVRLPVKSLVRFKCVSKPWLALISDPQFTRYHLSKSKSDDSNFQIMYALHTHIKRCSLYSALHKRNPSMQIYRMKFAAKNDHSIVGIINGLVCLNLKGTDLCIWNPALNRIRKIVCPKARGRRVDCFFSFGYEEANDDYKVVCLQTDIILYGEVTSIYSLKSDSWRRIDQFKGFFLPYPGVFANGKIYWYGSKPALSECKFVSLDMSSDEFVELQHPKYDADARRLEMGVSGGRPFVLCNYYQGNFSISKPKRVDLWVLDKHETEELWCKLVSIRYADVYPELDYFYPDVSPPELDNFDYRVLRISSNGEIVFGDPFGLIVYNWKNKESRKIKLAVDIDAHPRIAAYVESLVWPDYA